MSDQMFTNYLKQSGNKTQVIFTRRNYGRVYSPQKIAVNFSSLRHRKVQRNSGRKYCRLMDKNLDTSRLIWLGKTTRHGPEQHAPLPAHACTMKMKPIFRRNFYAGKFKTSVIIITVEKLPCILPRFIADKNNDNNNEKTEQENKSYFSSFAYFFLGMSSYAAYQSVYR